MFVSAAVMIVVCAIVLDMFPFMFFNWIWGL